MSGDIDGAIAALRKVEEAMRAGPWDVEDAGTENDANEWDAAEGTPSYWTWEIADGDYAILGGQELDDPSANVVGIVAMRNAFSALLDVAEAAERVNRWMTEDRYTQVEKVDGGFDLVHALDHLATVTKRSTDA